MAYAPAVARPYDSADVDRLRGSVHVEHTLARLGAERLRTLLDERDWVPALGALTGGQAVQMVRAGLESIYLSGWQVAADANLAAGTYPDQSLYPANSGPGARTAHQLGAAPRRPDRARGGRRIDPLARADRRGRRGRLRRPAERVRDHQRLHRGRRCGGPLRGPALVREEVRAPRRQGARPDQPVHPDARRGPPGRRRVGRADGARRPHRRALRVPSHERRRRGRPGVLHRRADERGLLPGARRDRRGDRARSGVRALRRPDLVRDVDPGPGRGGASSPRRSASGTPTGCSPTTARRRSTGGGT